MYKRLFKWFAGGISIRKKLTISFGVLVSVPIILLGIYTYQRSVENFVKQTTTTMQNNIDTVIHEMDYRFQREMESLKYLAFNLKLRKVLEYQPNDRVAIALTLNDTVEPVLWYYIASDNLIKGFDIFTPYIDSPLGDFLKSADSCEDQAWYAQHNSNFRNIWTYDGGNLYVSRAILDTTTVSRPLGVIRVTFFLGSFIEPFETPDYLGNGLLVRSSSGETIYHKLSGNPALDEGILSGSDDLPAALRVGGVIETSDWQVTYYIDRSRITGQLQGILRSTLWMVLGCLAAMYAVMGILARTLTRRIERLKRYAETIASGRLDATISTEDTDEIGVLTNAFGAMTVRLRNTIRQAYAMQLEKRAAELKALQAMINPHFLYNVLSSIKWRAIRKGDNDIATITGLLAKFYRTSLNEGLTLTDVRGELDNIRAYIELQQQLLDESFAVRYEIDQAVYDHSMLNFLLQPIVENAIKHGIACREDGDGLIVIKAGMSDDFLVFTVLNNGLATNMDTLRDLMDRPGKGYGIYNIRQRIEMYYGSDCGVFARIEDGMVCFEVKIAKQVEGWDE